MAGLGAAVPVGELDGAPSAAARGTGGLRPSLLRTHKRTTPNDLPAPPRPAPSPAGSERTGRQSGRQKRTGPGAQPPLAERRCCSAAGMPTTLLAVAMGPLQAAMMSAASSSKCSSSAGVKVGRGRGRWDDRMRGMQNGREGMKLVDHRETRGAKKGRCGTRPGSATPPIHKDAAPVRFSSRVRMGTAPASRACRPAETVQLPPLRARMRHLPQLGRRPPRTIEAGGAYPFGQPGLVPLPPPGG